MQVQNVGLVDGRDILDSGSYYNAFDQYSHGGHSTALSSPGAGQNHPATPQTPQTPSSIPNIILTGYFLFFVLMRFFCVLIACHLMTCSSISACWC